MHICVLMHGEPWGIALVLQAAVFHAVRVDFPPGIIAICHTDTKE